MALLSIDEGKCVKCGICAEVCPRVIIEFEEGEIPRGREGAEEMCIHCGHCVAVCPHGALSVSGMSVDECPEIDPSMDMTFDGVGQLVKSRRSIRVFKDEKVEKGVIEKVIDVARYAPTGMNRQPVKWKVIYDTDKVIELKDLVVEWMEGLVQKNVAIAALAGAAVNAEHYHLSPHLMRGSMPGPPGPSQSGV